MSTNPAQIDLWRSVSSEHQRLEFKEAKTQFDQEKLFRYCVARRAGSRTSPTPVNPKANA